MRTKLPLEVYGARSAPGPLSDSGHSALLLHSQPVLRTFVNLPAAHVCRKPLKVDEGYADNRICLVSLKEWTRDK